MVVLASDTSTLETDTEGSGKLQVTTPTWKVTVDQTSQSQWIRHHKPRVMTGLL